MQHVQSTEPNKEMTCSGRGRDLGNYNRFGGSLGSTKLRFPREFRHFFGSDGPGQLPALYPAADAIRNGMSTNWMYTLAG